MKVLSINSYSLGGLFIKLFTFSKWNHTAIMFSDGMVFDVTALSGVRKMHISEYVKEYKRIDCYEVAVPDETAGRVFAEAQLGKKYDFGAILGIVFQNRNWEEPDRWFCSEYAEATFVAAGKRRVRNNINSVLPRESYAIA